MIALLGQRALGLALEDRRIAVTELTLNGRRRSIHRALVFDFPAGASFDQPEALGRELGVFLRRNAIRCRRAVIGLPAIWLMCKRHPVPPVEGEALAGLLRISAERLFATEGKDLAVDFVPDSGTSGEKSVLLVATLRKRLTQATALAAAAGLKVLAVTSSSAALATAGPSSDSGMVLQLTPGAVELSIRSHRRLSSIQHVPWTRGGSEAELMEGLSRELRRILATGLDGAELNGDSSLTIWDGLGMDDAATGRLAGRLSVGKVERGELRRLADLNGSSTQEQDAGRFAASIALALGAVDRAVLPVDFTRTRLAPVKQSRFDRRRQIAAAAGVLLLLGGGYLLYDHQVQSAHIASLKATVASRAEAVKTARQFVDKVNQAEGWYANRPRLLECLRELSLVFPENSNIWAGSFSLREDLQGTISGRARQDNDVYALIEELKKRPEVFSDVQLQYVREGSKETREQTFAVKFQFHNPRM